MLPFPPLTLTAWVIITLRVRSVAVKLIFEFSQAGVKKGFDQKGCEQIA